MGTILFLTAEDAWKTHQDYKSSAVVWWYASCLFCNYEECFVRLGKAVRIPVPLVGNAGETTCSGVVAQSAVRNYMPGTKSQSKVETESFFELRRAEESFSV